MLEEASGFSPISEYVKELERLRLSKKLITAETSRDFVRIFQCNKCQKLFTGPIYVCSQGFDICSSCKAKCGKKLSCPIHGKPCKLSDNIMNYKLMELNDFKKTDMATHDNVYELKKFHDFLLSDEKLTAVKKIISCQCNKSFLDEKKIFFCTQGHLLCIECERCNCNNTKMGIVMNYKVIKFCELLRSSKPPTDLFPCLIQDCKEFLPLSMLSRHVQMYHTKNTGSVVKCTKSNTKKRSRMYCESLVYNGNSSFGFAFFSPEGDLLFLNGAITNDLDVPFNVIALNLEEGEGSDVPCTMRVHKGDEFYSCEEKFTLKLVTYEEQKPMDKYDHKFLAKKIAALKVVPTTSATHLYFRITLGSEADIGRQDMIAGGIDSGFRLTEYK